MKTEVSYLSPDPAGVEDAADRNKDRRMKTILFMGDSLTAGKLGASYLEVLQNDPEMRNRTFINAGEDGYTIEGIRIRMESILDSGNLPDVLVVEGGANDLLLPFMRSSGHEWDPFIRKLKRHGSIPLESEEAFREGMKRILSAAFDRGIKNVLTCTIPCLGENLSTPLNRKRERYNRIIRTVTGEFQESLYECSCVDAALPFEAELEQFQPGSDHLFKTPEELMKDAGRILKEGEDRICSERGLRLTIDGTHLNRTGAQMLAEVFRKALDSGTDNV